MFVTTLTNKKYIFYTDVLRKGLKIELISSEGIPKILYHFGELLDVIMHSH